MKHTPRYLLIFGTTVGLIGGVWMALHGLQQTQFLPEALRHKAPAAFVMLMVGLQLVGLAQWLQSRRDAGEQAPDPVKELTTEPADSASRNQLGKEECAMSSEKNSSIVMGLIGRLKPSKPAKATRAKPQRPAKKAAVADQDSIVLGLLGKLVKRGRSTAPEQAVPAPARTARPLAEPTAPEQKSIVLGLVGKLMKRGVTAPAAPKPKPAAKEKSSIVMGLLSRLTGRSKAATALEDAAPVAVRPQRRSTAATPRPARPARATTKLGDDVLILQPEDRLAAPNVTPIRPRRARAGRGAAPASVHATMGVSVPQQPSDSWLGGLPSLPADTQWPQTETGAPDRFLAQIALADLPAGVWAGLGPRDGWLVFFETTVLHTDSLGTPHPIPEGAEQTPRTAAEDWMEDTLGPLPSPHWFLSAQDGTGIAPAPMPPLSGRDVAFYPFDWPSTFALLDALETVLQDTLTSWQERAAPKLPKAVADKRKDAFMAGITKVRALNRKVANRAETHDFTSAVAKRVVSELKAMTNDAWRSAKARKEGKPAVTILEMAMGPEYLAMFERHARQVYSTTPRALPARCRAKLEPHWAEAATGIAAEIGAATEGSGWPVLLSLPSGGLADAPVGAVDRMLWTIAPEDLSEGRFDRVVIEVEPRPKARRHSHSIAS
ncbi:DUF1963 domain-containing protein [Mesobacterium sp. TK19101]|uniref:DUF1963 domain-containing protein n=1 Tax=Mesobacterium hydrothermale TaxID=3111907 RepID=A0ABU6HPL7_9RHOB|nr:DUF1963 domain-containing protein [Mesobacterium sp. TK19101]MEC3863180.1 DUF1963 domain-containing protein [Mesobacterium sp. TK19101]